MRQFSIILFVILFFMSGNLSYSALHGRIDYSIPVDYSKLSEQELEEKAKFYYHNALQHKDNETNIHSDTTNALVLYSALQKINPTETKYYIKAGILYDKISKDRQAKGCLFRAVSISKNNPEAFFYLGEFYYRRQSYKPALKNYLKAYNYGYQRHSCRHQRRHHRQDWMHCGPLG